MFSLKNFQIYGVIHEMDFCYSLCARKKYTMSKQDVDFCAVKKMQKFRLSRQRIWLLKKWLDVKTSKTKMSKVKISKKECSGWRHFFNIFVSTF